MKTVDPLQDHPGGSRKGLNDAKGIKAEKTYPYAEIVERSFLNKASGKA